MVSFIKNKTKIVNLTSYQTHGEQASSESKTKTKTREEKEEEMSYLLVSSVSSVRVTMPEGRKISAERRN